MIIKIFGVCIYLYNGLFLYVELDCYSGDRDVGRLGYFIFGNFLFLY